MTLSARFVTKLAIAGLALSCIPIPGPPITITTTLIMTHVPFYNIHTCTLYDMHICTYTHTYAGGAAEAAAAAGGGVGGGLILIFGLLFLYYVYSKKGEKAASEAGEKGSELTDVRAPPPPADAASGNPLHAKDDKLNEL